MTRGEKRKLVTIGKDVESSVELMEWKWVKPLQKSDSS